MYLENDFIRVREYGELRIKFHCICDKCGKDRGYMRKRYANKLCISCANKDWSKIKDYELVWDKEMDHAESIVPRIPTIDFIQRKVCDYFNIESTKLCYRSRKMEVVGPRQISMYFSKILTQESLHVIGRRHGNFDHSTVINSCKTVNNLKDTNGVYRQQIEDIERKLKVN